MRIRSLALRYRRGPLAAGLLLLAAPADAGSLYCTDSTIANTLVEWVPGANLANVTPDCLGAFIDLSGTALANRLGCELPPKHACGDGPCAMCPTGGGGASVDGGGAAWGEGAGNATGRHWSHDYAERIVVDPDDSQVWLLTRMGTFREFSGLAAGVYTINSPSDDYRTLRRTAGGWQLEELDALVHDFDNAGLWLASTDRFDNAKTATYTAGSLTAVDFPDGRSESFAYHPTGKLATIAEVGAGASPPRATVMTCKTTLPVSPTPKAR